MPRTIRADELPDIARGCSVLGAGGGGEAYTATLMAMQAIGDHGPVELVSYDDLPDDGIIMSCGFLGAPTVTIEKLSSGDEGSYLREEVERLRGAPVSALMCAEIGGSNGMVPLTWAARMGLPVLDADGMGRAFPEVQQVTMHLAGIPAAPAVVVDERGHRAVIHQAEGMWAERLERAIAIACGGIAASAEYTMTVTQARTATVPGTVTLAGEIGRAISGAITDPVAAVIAATGAARLLDGKVVDVERRFEGGFIRGTATIEGTRADAGSRLVIEIQNEFLVARVNGAVRATAPDIISLLDEQTGEAIHTERLRYGQRLVAVAIPCPPIWRTPIGLETAGPAAFGFDLPYVPVEELNPGTGVWPGLDAGISR
ncbi:MAG: DUF917 domain-containing protein [Candidatus Limnocylindrales bacterium]